MFKDKIWVMDGATGTQLQKLGMPAKSCTEQWVLENPDKFVEMQRAYVEAGSDMVYAPTFGANRVNLSNHGVEADIDEMCAVLVALSRRAAGDRALVIGDISSTGLLVEPYGDTEEDELLEVFTQQAAALEKAGVDAFGVETQMYLDEARLAVKAVRSVSNKPLIVSFTIGPTGKTIWGEDLRDIIDELEEYSPAAFGINCCGDMELMCQVLSQLKEHTDIPLVAKPNAGIPVMRDGKSVYELPAEQLGEYAARFIDCGAKLIGGCCGTTQEHIAAIRKVVDAQ